MTSLQEVLDIVCVNIDVVFVFHHVNKIQCWDERV